MSLVLHYHPLSSFCWKALIALYEKGLTFEPRLVNLGDADERAQLAARWPLLKIPLLEAGGRAIPETTIQIEYLEQLHPEAPALLAGDAEQRLEIRLCDRLFDLYVMQPMQRHVAQWLRPEAERDALTLAATRAELRQAYGMLEQRLAGRAWATGERFSLADCAAAPALFYAVIVEPLPADAPVLAAYLERLLARPSVQRVLDEARPYFHLYPLRHALPARYRPA